MSIIVPKTRIVRNNTTVQRFIVNRNKHIHTRARQYYSACDVLAKQTLLRELLSRGEKKDCCDGGCRNKTRRARNKFLAKNTTSRSLRNHAGLLRRHYFNHAWATRQKLQCEPPHHGRNEKFQSMVRDKHARLLNTPKNHTLAVQNGQRQRQAIYYNIDYVFSRKRAGHCPEHVPIDLHP